MPNDNEEIQSGAGAHNRLVPWLRGLAGVTLLLVVVTWAIREGTLLDRVSGPLLFWSTLFSLLTNVLQAATMRSIALAYRRKLGLGRALHIGTLGSLGNAVGGLPIGTTVKFAILCKGVGLTMRQTASGFIVATAATLLFLAILATLSAMWLEFPMQAKLVIAFITLTGIAAALGMRRWIQTGFAGSALLRPVVNGNAAGPIALLSLATAVVFVVHCCVVGILLQPGYPLLQLAFTSASGIAFSAASLLQGIGGIQEIAMGLTALLSGAQPLDGVQIALVLRLTSIVSACLVLVIFYFFPRRPGHLLF